MRRCAISIVMLAVCLFAGLTNAYAQPQTVVIDRSHLKQRTRLHIGDTLIVQLRAYAGTNYRWVFARTHSQLLTLQGSTTQPERPRLLGGPIIQSFHFLATHVGHTHLSFALRTTHIHVLGRPDQEVSFNVRVTSPSGRRAGHE